MCFLLLSDCVIAGPKTINLRIVKTKGISTNPLWKMLGSFSGKYFVNHLGIWLNCIEKNVKMLSEYR